MEHLRLQNFFQLSGGFCWFPDRNLESQRGETLHPVFSIWFTISNKGKIVYKSSILEKGNLDPLPFWFMTLPLHTAFEWLLLKNLSLPKYIVQPPSLLVALILLPRTLGLNLGSRTWPD